MFPIKEYVSPGQQGGKGQNSLHNFGGIWLQGRAKRSQVGSRSDIGAVCYTKCLENFKQECGKTETEPEDMGWFTPIT